MNGSRFIHFIIGAILIFISLLTIATVQTTTFAQDDPQTTLYFVDPRADLTITSPLPDTLDIQIGLVASAVTVDDEASASAEAQAGADTNAPLPNSVMVKGPGPQPLTLEIINMISTKGHVIDTSDIVTCVWDESTERPESCGTSAAIVDVLPPGIHTFTVEFVKPDDLTVDPGIYEGLIVVDYGGSQALTRLITLEIGPPPEPAILSPKVIVSAISCPNPIPFGVWQDIRNRLCPTHAEKKITILPAGPISITTTTELDEKHVANAQGVAIIEDGYGGRVGLRLSALRDDCLRNEVSKRPATCPEYAIRVSGSTVPGKYTGKFYLDPDHFDEGGVDTVFYVRHLGRFASIVLIGGIVTNALLRFAIKKYQKSLERQKSGNGDPALGWRFIAYLILVFLAFLAGYRVLYVDNATYGTTADYIKTYLWGASGDIISIVLAYNFDPKGLDTLLGKLKEAIPGIKKKQDENA